MSNFRHSLLLIIILSLLSLTFSFVTSFSDTVLWYLHEHSPFSFLLIPGQSGLICSAIAFCIPLRSSIRYDFVIAFVHRRERYGGPLEVASPTACTRYTPFRLLTFGLCETQLSSINNEFRLDVRITLNKLNVYCAPECARINGSK